MARQSRIAFIGNSLPRRCGIATFTADLQQAVAASRIGVDTTIVAMTDRGLSYDYPASVGFQIRENILDDYIDAAEFLNAGGYDFVSLQHEFGIFGGAAGGYIMELLSRLNMPIVTTFHTVLANPTPDQRRVMDRIIQVSSRVIVMAEKGRRLLHDVHQAAMEKIEVIPHGVPDVAFAPPCRAKADMGYLGRSVILTFGLLSPNKGIEVMIDAMPYILKLSPNAVYVVLGATHPNLVSHEGESYRASLVSRVRELGIEDHVVFLDCFVDQEQLLKFIMMCDVYVTPYLSEAQMTSGTLSYSFGLGKAVVSTPYWHARELLTDGNGILVPFGDTDAIGREIAALLTNDDRRDAIRRRAYANSRSMTWARIAERYLATFENARRVHRLKLVEPTAAPPPVSRLSSTLPPMQLEYLHSMCDETGLFQHAVHSVADRSHGYCVDDNARALLLACALNNLGENRLPDALIARFAAFVQHAWNPDTRQFRNFMSFNRKWLEATGSEDSHGRTLWALGVCAQSDVDPSRRRWAETLFATALPITEKFSSPRAWAFALLGLEAYCTVAEDPAARRLQSKLADRLMNLLGACEAPDWVWFEASLAYDNARLSQALIATGESIGSTAMMAAGIRTLRWLVAQQTSAAELFRPIGTAGFGEIRKPPRAFDQQPLEAAATISACLAAWRVDGKNEWTMESARAFSWFLGSNDLGVPLVDLRTGSCRDGLHPDRPNENRGGESVVSWLLALAEMRQMARATQNLFEAGNARGLKLWAPATAAQTSRGSIVKNSVSEPTITVPAPRPWAGGRAAVQAGDRTTRSQPN